MEHWLLLTLAVLVGVAIPFVFPYRMIAALFGGFYHNKAKHLILLTRNSQRAVEWRIWSYFFWNRLMGKKGHVTSIDTGSTDDTLKILYRLKKRYDRLEVIKLHPTITVEEAIESCVGKHQGDKEKMVVLDLQEVDQETKKHSA
ncbi:hypothetical protein SAMN05444392_105139 [Seinonella peptonophila]|uniref:Uncharacterized protein n=1 Tax=Seinonella peptonophila TaxID=112248 RepID=A0A1M4XRB0_9BACL|nr:hypothetical protein [Seinonella peptonophila]SHE96107.1 hypothetical protein SAMN05444392_105139 [Seinonella peptonophila]